MTVTILPEKLTLKAARDKAVCDGTGAGSLSLKVPGIALTKNARVIAEGIAWFDSQNAGDRVTKLQVVDHDDILGGGVGAIVKKYHDDKLAVANQGWWIPTVGGVISLKALGRFGRLTGGLYLDIHVQKGNNAADTFRCNIRWGRPK